MFASEYQCRHTKVVVKVVYHHRQKKKKSRGQTTHNSSLENLCLGWLAMHITGQPTLLLCLGKIFVLVGWPCILQAKPTLLLENQSLSWLVGHAYYRPTNSSLVSWENLCLGWLAMHITGQPTLLLCLGKIFVLVGWPCANQLFCWYLVDPACGNQ